MTLPYGRIPSSHYFILNIITHCWPLSFFSPSVWIGSSTNSHILNVRDLHHCQLKLSSMGCSLSQCQFLTSNYLGFVSFYIVDQLCQTHLVPGARWMAWIRSGPQIPCLYAWSNACSTHPGRSRTVAWGGAACGTAHDLATVGPGPASVAWNVCPGHYTHQSGTACRSTEHQGLDFGAPWAT